MNKMGKMAAVVVVVALCAVAQAEIVMETVTVGNPGNEGEWSGESYGGYGPDAFVGAVDYAYNTGKYEVTAGQYTQFLNAVAASDLYGLYNPWMSSSGFGCKIQQSGSSPNYTYSVAIDWADRPVNCVDWYDTLRFANWMHNGQPTGVQDASTTEDGAYDMSLGASAVRKPGATWFLPTEDEWYKAAYHMNDGDTGNYFDYPTSSDTAPGYVNDSGNLSGTGDSFTEGGTDPGNYATYNGDGFTEGIGSPYYRTEVGEWENSDSPYGTFDQGGNVWEWNETLIGSLRGIRGGSYNWGDINFLASSNRSSFDPLYAYNFFGFRVASEVPEPATLSLLSLGGLAVLKRRR